MPLCYVACIPHNLHTENPLMVARSWFPSVFYTQGVQVLVFNSEAYEEFQCGCYLGTCGKWITCFLFIPPLALFARCEEARHVIEIHKEPHAQGGAL